MEMQHIKTNEMQQHSSKRDVYMDAAAESPGELPPPLRKPLKNLSTTFWFKATATAFDCASQDPGVPHFAPKASQSVA